MAYEERVRYRLSTEDLVVRAIERTYDENKLRAELAVTQWEYCMKKPVFFRLWLRRLRNI